MDSNNKKEEKLYVRCLKRLAAFLRERYIFTFITIQSFASWFTFLFTLLGIHLCLLQIKEGTVQLTFLGAVCLIIVGLVNLICNIALLYDERTDGKYNKLSSALEKERESGAVLTELKESMNTLCESKLRTLTTQLDDYIQNPQKKPPEVISDPQKQLDAIADELSLRMSHLLKFDQRQYGKDALYTSIIYQFPQDEDPSWRCATPQRGLPVSELLEPKGNKRSTFLFLLENRDHFIFENSKQAAADKGYYIPDNEDFYDEETGKLKGSIACFRHRIMDRRDHVIVDFVITITSYNRKFVENCDGSNKAVTSARDKINRVLIPGYLIRASIELCQLYVKTLHERRSGQPENIKLHLKRISLAEPDSLDRSRFIDPDCEEPGESGRAGTDDSGGSGPEDAGQSTVS